MFLLSSLNLMHSLDLLLDGRRAEDGRPAGSGTEKSDFPEGKLSSAAWEGWWHEEAA